MSDEKGITKQRRERLGVRNSLWRDCGNESQRGTANEEIEYEATLRQLEQGLAAVTAERDAYKAAIHAMIWDSTLPNLIAHYRTRATRNFHAPIGEKFRAIIVRLEAIRNLGTAPQPSGNSGGFEAAAGILADTWDGEPSEVTIRRLRDGTPAEEELP